MRERVLVPYGGSYHEEWNDQYHLTVQYEGQQFLPLVFCEEGWRAEESLPALPLAERYFAAAADAQVAAERFLASGLSADDLSELAPGKSRDALFAADTMRILMDEYGLHMETVWAYAETAFRRELTIAEREQLSVLQPRTAAVYDLLRDLVRTIPAARHDLRLEEYRCPVGALRTGDTLRLSVKTGTLNVISATLELFGDTLQRAYSMDRTERGWSVKIQMPEDSAALWYRFRLTDEEKTRWLCAAPDGAHGWMQDEPRDGFRLTVYEKDFETPDWFPGGVMYQIFPDRFAFSDDGGAERGIRYHLELHQTPELHGSIAEEPRWQPRDFEKEYSPDDFYGGRLSAIRSKLPYLRSLGVTCIYLNPIVEARSNHRYDTSDYRHVDPILGTNADFEELCREADQFGIRVLCDGVFSHTGADSVYFNRDGHYPEAGACQPEHSPWDSWYDFRHFPDDYRSWWGFRDLPEVLEHGGKMVAQDLTGIGTVELPALGIYRNIDVFTAAGGIVFIHQSLFVQPVHNLGKITAGNAQPRCDLGHGLAFFFIFQQVLQHLDLGKGIGHPLMLQLLSAVDMRIYITVPDQCFHHITVFTHPFQFHGSYPPFLRKTLTKLYHIFRALFTFEIFCEYSTLKMFPVETKSDGVSQKMGKIKKGGLQK